MQNGDLCVASAADALCMVILECTSRNPANSLD